MYSWLLEDIQVAMSVVVMSFLPKAREGCLNLSWPVVSLGFPLASMPARPYSALGRASIADIPHKRYATAAQMLNALSHQVADRERAERS